MTIFIVIIIIKIVSVFNSDSLMIDCRDTVNEIYVTKNIKIILQTFKVIRIKRLLH